MRKKEIKKYERKKGSKTYHYRINMSKKDYEELGKTVHILSPKKYNELQKQIEKIESTELVRKTEIRNLKNELKGLKEGIKKHEKSLIKPLKELLKKNKI